MYKVFILCLYLTGAGAAAAVTVLHPFVVNPHIISCGDPECTRDIHAAIDGVELRPVPVLYPPYPKAAVTNAYNQLEILGVRCSYVDSAGQVYPDRCQFGVGAGYAPRLDIRTCALKSSEAWDLDTNANTCTLNKLDWVIPALPKTERPVVCLVFASRNTYQSGIVRTPGGDVTPDQLVAAGANGCVVLAKPPVPCEINLPAEIDHGTVGVNDTHKVVVGGTVRCGFLPQFLVGDVLNGSKTIPMGPGVTSTIALMRPGDERTVQVTSTLRVINGAPGVHQGAVVIRVMPY